LAAAYGSIIPWKVRLPLERASLRTEGEVPLRCEAADLERLTRVGDDPQVQLGEGAEGALVQLKLDRVRGARR